MSEWTDEMAGTWRHYRGDVAAMAAKHRAIYGVDPERPHSQPSTADWIHAGRIAAVLGWVEAHGKPPVALDEVA